MKKIILVFMLSPLTAWAASGSGFNVGLSALMYNLDFSGDSYNPAQSSKRTHANLKLGYLMSNNLYFGGTYSTLNTSSTGTNGARTATGLVLGYHSNGYFLDFTYFFGGNYQLSDTVTEKEASGMGLEIGYNAMVSSSFYIGAELNYMSLNYKKREISGVDATVANTYTEMYPMLNVGFVF